MVNHYEAAPAGHACGCASLMDPAFLDALDEKTRRIIMDPSTAPELVNNGAEIEASYERHELTDWQRGAWRLHKEVIDDAFEGGWDNPEHPWGRAMEDFWKYSIAFSSYALPSLVMIDESLWPDAIECMRRHILLMKEASCSDSYVREEFGNDPLSSRNQMYKGHLNLMYGLYKLMGGGNEFDEEYHQLNTSFVNESRRCWHDRGFWGVECEPDQWFTPCNSVGIMSYKVYDLVFGTDYTKTVGLPTARFIDQKMFDKRTGLYLFRYHPSVDYAEPYVIGDCWTAAMLNWFSPQNCARQHDAIKRHFLEDIKGGMECYLKANMNTHGDSTDYEQRTWVLYTPFMAREFHDLEMWDKITRYFVDMYDIKLVNGVMRFTTASSGIESHAQGYLFLGAVHVGWKEILEYDWAGFRARMKR